jgi:hypothetical protein
VLQTLERHSSSTFALSFGVFAGSAGVRGGARAARAALGGAAVLMAVGMIVFQVGSHFRFVPPFVHYFPDLQISEICKFVDLRDLLRDSVPLFLTTAARQSKAPPRRWPEPRTRLESRTRRWSGAARSRRAGQRRRPCRTLVPHRLSRTHQEPWRLVSGYMYLRIKKRLKF